MSSWLLLFLIFVLSSCRRYKPSFIIWSKWQEEIRTHSSLNFFLIYSFDLFMRSSFQYSSVNWHKYTGLVHALTLRYSGQDAVLDFPEKWNGYKYTARKKTYDDGNLTGNRIESCSKSWYRKLITTFWPIRIQNSTALWDQISKTFCSMSERIAESKVPVLNSASLSVVVRTCRPRR